MIVRDGLGDLEAVSVMDATSRHGNRAPSTIRANCHPVACDTVSRALLYDLEQSMASLAARRRRTFAPRGCPTVSVELGGLELS